MKAIVTKDASSDFYVPHAQFFLQSWQIVTPAFKFLWKFGLSIIMQDTKL